MRIQKQTQIFTPKWIDSDSQSHLHPGDTLIHQSFSRSSCPTSVIILSLPTVEYGTLLMESKWIKLQNYIDYVLEKEYSAVGRN